MTTPGQTIGPFFGYALPYPGDAELVPRTHPSAVRLHGRVLDGAGAPVPDALLELWQPAPDGSIVQEPGSLHRDGYTFTGWGRCATNNAGEYSFTTLPPGNGFFTLAVFARGLLDRLFTRAYLPNATSPLLSSVPPERRRTLLTTPSPDGYTFDVVLQGPTETVFLT